LTDEIEYNDEEQDGDDYFIIKGPVTCIGDIRVEIYERLKLARGGWWFQSTSKRRATVVEYSYSVVLNGVGNIFRYDSPHPDHRPYHHRHNFSPPGVKRDPPTEIPSEEVPRIGQVLREAEQWYWANRQEGDEDG
jgi:hypothetical protein